MRSVLIHMYLDIQGICVRPSSFSPTASQNQSAWVAIYAYRHEWQKAGCHHVRQGRAGRIFRSRRTRVMDISRWLMSATDSTSRRRALEIFEKEARISWQNDGTPTTSIPMGRDMSLEIGLADLMMRAGDRMRARRVLEMVLSASDLAGRQVSARRHVQFLQPCSVLAPSSSLGRDDRRCARRAFSGFSALGLGSRCLATETPIPPSTEYTCGDERFQRVIAGASCQRGVANAPRSRRVAQSKA